MTQEDKDKTIAEADKKVAMSFLLFAMADTMMREGEKDLHTLRLGVKRDEKRLIGDILAKVRDVKVLCKRLGFVARQVGEEQYGVIVENAYYTDYLQNLRLLLMTANAMHIDNDDEAALTQLKIESNLKLLTKHDFFPQQWIDELTEI